MTTTPMTTVQTIESHDMNLATVYTSFYVVPNYQREYVWETMEVEKLLDDILTEFRSTETPTSSEYFIGSIVVCGRPDGVIELIDGQQRVTTAYLFLCALRDYLRMRGLEPIGALDSQIAAKDIDAEGNDVFRHRVELQYEDSGDILKRIVEGTIHIDGTNTTRSIENIRNAYSVIGAFLQREFGEDVNTLRRFYSFFTKNVKLVRIRTQSVAHALKIFETINDRGKGLDSMDLLKNLMFMRASQADFERLKTKWKELVDALYRASEKPLRFLRYFIFANYDVDRLREEEIYDWFVKNEKICGYRARPLAFVDELLAATRAYVSFAEGKDAQGTPNRYLENVRLLSGSARQHLILLLAGRHLPSDLFSVLCRHVENLFFVYTITRENTREFERKFALWARELRSVSDQAGLAAFLGKTFEPEKSRLSERFDFAFANLDARAVQQYRMRYLLGKLTQFINEHAYGSAGTEADLKTYVNKKIHVEHILPENPSKEALAEFDLPEQAQSYAQRLGNLCLIEEPYNTSLGNRPYSVKKDVYKQSKFLLTKAIAEKVTAGKETAVDRAVRGIEPFSSWTSSSIEGRQEMLGQLARRVWEMSIPEEGAAASLALAAQQHPQSSTTASSAPTNPFQQGRTTAKIFDILADGRWHSLSEIQSLFPRKKIERRIANIREKGERAGMWMIEENENRVRMTWPGQGE